MTTTQAWITRKIKLWMKRKTISRKALRVDLAKDPGTVTKLLKGQKNLRASTIDEVLTVLKLTPEEFFADREWSAADVTFKEEIEKLKAVLLSQNEHWKNYILTSLDVAFEQVNAEKARSGPPKAVG